MKLTKWSNTWYGISFKDLNVKLNFFSRPNSHFYSEFYKNFFKRYNSLEELPSNFKSKKFEIAKKILTLIESNLKVLSIGCGTGLIEMKMTEINKDLEIDAYDFSSVAKNWIDKIDRVNFETDINNEKKYDIIFCSALLYAMSNYEVIKFSQLVKDKLNTNAIFLIIESSLNPEENGYKTKFNWIKLLKIKVMYTILIFLNLRKEKYQFWGWQRDNYEIQKLLKIKGFNLKDKFSCAENSFLIFQVNNY